MIEVIGMLVAASSFALGYVAASAHDPVISGACCLAALGVVGLVLYGGRR